jgi:regulatory protein
VLAGRPHSVAELRRKLLSRGCDAPAVETALERLSGLGYLDDAAFARSLVARRSEGRGRALIAAELGARGVDREVAERALGELGRDEQLAAARRLARRSPTDDPRRLAARLQRRGFAPDVIREVVGPLPTVTARQIDSASAAI